MIAGPWKPVLTDIDRASEFTGDDKLQYSKLVDLGADFEFASVFIPTIDNGTVTLYVQRDGEEDTVPVIVHFFHNIDLDTDVPQSTIAGTGAIVIVFNIGAVQFLRLKTSVNQTADRTFYVRGFNRG